MNVSIGDYVQTTEEYNPLGSISGKVIEDHGNKVVIIDDCAEFDDDLYLLLNKSDLEIVKTTLAIKESQQWAWELY